MSTITKEWLQQKIADMEATRDDIPFGLDEEDRNTLAAMKLALASLEAEAVAYIFKHPAGRLFWALTDESNKGQSDVMPVYSVPVPAFVPPAIEPDYEVIKGILPTANPDEYACCIAADMWNACRDAMLQGADGNPQWVACSERMPEPEVDVQVYCSDKKEQMVGYLERNEPEGCFRFATWRNGDGIYCQPTHWMPLPAAPKQEVK